MASMATSDACSARARRSARSPVITVPPGSATAVTRAPTADPAQARARSQAALRASARTVSAMSVSRTTRSMNDQARSCVTHRGDVSQKGVQLFVGIEDTVLGEIISRGDGTYALPPYLFVDRLDAPIRRHGPVVGSVGRHGHPRYRSIPVITFPVGCRAP